MTFLNNALVKDNGFILTQLHSRDLLIGSSYHIYRSDGVKQHVLIAESTKLVQSYHDILAPKCGHGDTYSPPEDVFRKDVPTL